MRSKGITPELNPSNGFEAIPGRRLLLQAAAATLLLSVIPRGQAAGNGNVVAVRVWPSHAYTRVTIESTTPLNFKHFMLKNPERLVVDLEGIEINSQLQSLAGKVLEDDPYIQQLRAGRNKPDIVRLVLDMKTEIRPQVFTLPPVAEYQHRLVIDLYPAHQDDPLLAFLSDQDKPEGAPLAKSETLSTPPRGSDKPAGAERKPGEKTADKPESVERDKLKVDRLITVVLDPGHGGEDPGAIGPAGTYEKTVVLAIARRLKTLLEEEPNVRVVLTRDGDYFVPLGTRVKKARAVQADLFVSIHADAALRPDASGASVFALSDKSATSVQARMLAKSQNEADLIGGVKLDNRNPELARVLMDLTMTSTINDSLKLGKVMLGELGDINRLHKPQVEQAGFAVLKAPDIPSVLVETAFISNPAEEQKLISDDYQQKMALALHRGIKRYFAKYPPQPRTKLASK
ncbi:N-acetylmuramoyl-L-alanine amidase [Chitinilyticum litopenaei]|uniref:N-acetylmuramoyl-L-alanine amidase n=1 Tax=Chitinilyticum litopenaei TaxID=1121276 RepID=UPI000412F676|nr:N-acetylmuramoyl-L-alanine amidase [Chitinilyticum litopenaei]